MNDREWDTFFDLLAKIVNEPKPVSEKIEQLRGKADDRASSADLEEFEGWFSD